MNRSTFISYRRTDGTDLPANLDRYLKQEQINSYCDQNDPANGAPIRQKVIEEEYSVDKSEKPVKRHIVNRSAQFMP